MPIFETYWHGPGAFQHFHSPNAILLFFFFNYLGRESAIKKQETIAAQYSSGKDTWTVMPLVSVASAAQSPRLKAQQWEVCNERNSQIHVNSGLSFFRAKHFR